MTGRPAHLLQRIAAGATVLTAAALAAGLSSADALATLGPSWGLVLLLAAAAGLWAWWRTPTNPAARRLAVSGAAGLTWLTASVWLVVLARQLGGATTPSLTNVARHGYLAATLGVQVLGLAFAASQAAVLVRYPDGAPRQAAEAWTVRVLAVLVPILPVVLLLTNEHVVPAWVIGWASGSDGWTAPVIPSPLAVPALAGAGPLLAGIDQGMLALGPLAGLVVLVARVRVMPSTERRRMGWPLLAAVALAVAITVDQLARRGALPHLVGDGILMAGQLVLPVCLAVGIAAPTLFDALGTVRRTVPFLLASGVVLGGSVGTAWLLGTGLAGENLRTAVVVAVLAALLLEPLRRAVTERLARVALRQPPTGEVVLRRLGDALEHTLDRPALTTSIAHTALEGLAVEWVTLAPRDGRPVHAGRPRRDGEEPVMRVPLLRGSSDLGELACGPSVDGRLVPKVGAQLTELARQVALALDNARLAAESSERLAEVAASRQRLVTAEDRARLRLERDLHDGAQQDLAALITRAALAQRQVDRGDTAAAARTLGALHGDAVEALTGLREIVSGISSAALADVGLVAALESRAARCPLPVRVVASEAARAARLPEAVAGAAWFTVSEALTNTLKHSGASRVEVGVDVDAGPGVDVLRLRVHDDGCGFDAARIATSSAGLVGVRDRVTALGGDLVVESCPGGGATVRARIPVEHAP